jgi:hypothetical protein
LILWVLCALAFWAGLSVEQMLAERRCNGAGGQWSDARTVCLGLR